MKSFRPQADNGNLEYILSYALLDHETPSKYWTPRFSRENLSKQSISTIQVIPQSSNDVEQ